MAGSRATKSGHILLLMADVRFVFAAGSMNLSSWSSVVGEETNRNLNDTLNSDWTGCRPTRDDATCRTRRGSTPWHASARQSAGAVDGASADCGRRSDDGCGRNG